MDFIRRVGLALSFFLAAMPAMAEEAGVEPIACSPIQGYLSGSLYLPSNAKLVAIVDVGAQAWDRWGNVEGGAQYGHYEDLALGLSRGGLAVVLYDKRGTGASPGPTNEMAMRVRDSESMSACVSKRLPGMRQVRVGHSAGTVVVSTAPSARAGTVLLSPIIPRDRWPTGPVLALRGANDPTVTEGDVIPGADHLLMRGGDLAPDVVERILKWAAGL